MFSFTEISRHKGSEVVVFFIVKGFGRLIIKLALKVSLCHVLNHDIRHWPEILIFRVLFKTLG